MKNTTFVFLLILAAAIFADGQFQSEGKLNTWTTEKVQRNYAIRQE